MFVSGRGKCPERQREKLLVKEWFTWFNYLLLWCLLVLKVFFLHLVCSDMGRLSQSAGMCWSRKIDLLSDTGLWTLTMTLYICTAVAELCVNMAPFSSFFPSLSNPRHFGCAQLWSAVHILQTVVQRRLCFLGYVVAACRMSCSKWTYSAIKSQFSPYCLSSSLMLALPFARQFPSHKWVTVKRWQRHLLNVIHGGSRQNVPQILRIEEWSWRQNMPQILRIEGWSFM